MPTSVAIIVAMESEREKLDPVWGPPDHEIRDGWEVFRLQRHGAEVAIIRCDIGMTNAAAATEYAIQRWQPAVIFNFGCSGAHQRTIRPGDVVIGTTLVHQGRMIFAPGGEIAPLAVAFTVPGEDQARADLACDAGLVALAQDVAATTPLPHWPGADRAPAVLTGPIASGDVWLQDPARIDAAHAHHGCLCEDMEAQAIAQVSTRHGVPFLSIKDISNNEFDGATAFEAGSSPLPRDELGVRSATLLAATIDAWLTR